MSYEAEVTQNAAQQVLVVAPRIEAYLKKATGKSYKLKKPFLRDKMCLHARFVGRKPRTKGDPFDLDTAILMPDGFMLEITYLPGPDLYNMRSYYISGTGNVSGEHAFSEVYVDVLEQPDLLFRDAVRSLGKEESLRMMVAAFRTILEGQDFQVRLDGTQRFKNKKGKAEKAAPNPAAVAARIKNPNDKCLKSEDVDALAWEDGEAVAPHGLYRLRETKDAVELRYAKAGGEEEVLGKFQAAEEARGSAGRHHANGGRR